MEHRQRKLGGQAMAETGPTNDVAALAVNRDGTTVAAGFGDGTIVLWDLATRRQQPHGRLTTPTKRTGGTTVVALSNDGRLVASRTLDGEVLLSPAVADPQQLCDKLSTNLTHAQWRDWVSPAIPYIAVCPKLAVQQD